MATCAPSAGGRRTRTGHLSGRREFLGLLQNLPYTNVDAHFLAATMITGAGLWTRDKRLAAAATRLGLTDSKIRGAE